jgi:hypothetical protein
MLAGIALTVLDVGLPVTLIERDLVSLERGMARVGQVYDGIVSRGRLRTDIRSERLERLSGGVDYALLADADVVIEAAFEDMAVKASAFQNLIASASRVRSYEVPYATASAIREYLALNGTMFDAIAIGSEGSGPQRDAGLSRLIASVIRVSPTSFRSSRP